MSQKNDLSLLFRQTGDKAGERFGFDSAVGIGGWRRQIGSLLDRIGLTPSISAT